MSFRVHWLLITLPIDFRRSYRKIYDYDRHNYCFYRNRGYSLLDCFIVVRSSSKCWRIMYVNCKNKDILYFSCRLCSEVVSIMYSLFKKNTVP